MGGVWASGTVCAKACIAIDAQMKTVMIALEIHNCLFNRIECVDLLG